ncbi:MAG: PD-(D/E)XK nuclease family protein [Bacillota bacterium]
MPTLERKREPEIVPQYSLTGDLLSFLRCGLQYRYLNGSALPPSRPVQLWFGEFIHGVMEAAYRIWHAGTPPAFPWPMNVTPFGGPSPAGRLPHDIGTIGETVEETLHALGKNARSGATRASAYRRAERAVNELAPHLFPLIQSAEEKVIGTRDVPPLPAGTPWHPRCTRYELHGIIDVLTNVQLSAVPTGNVIRDAVYAACPGLAGQYEVIVDYKGSRRPATNHPFWDQAEWQLQTYAWLRTRQPQAIPVAAGVLIYINELAPGNEDLVNLRREISHGHTDVAPSPGTPDAYVLNTWRPGATIPAFSLEYRMRRAIRVVPFDAVSQANATAQFDQVVVDIEHCVADENAAGDILAHWQSVGDDDTCVACDFRHFCPSPAPHTGHHTIDAPPAQ